MSMEWKPIETAPRDGEPIIVAAGGYKPVLARWRDFDNPLVHWRSDVPQEKRREIMEGDWRHALDTARRLSYPPTHWMPLPEPPPA